MQNLPTVLKIYISSFLSYEDNKRLYKLLKCKRPKRPALHIFEVSDLYRQVVDRSISIEKFLPPLENWYIRTAATTKDWFEENSPAAVLGLVSIMKYYCNNNTDVYFQCLGCRRYNKVKFNLYCYSTPQTTNIRQIIYRRSIQNDCKCGDEYQAEEVEGSAHSNWLVDRFRMPNLTPAQKEDLNANVRRTMKNGRRVVTTKTIENFIIQILDNARLEADSSESDIDFDEKSDNKSYLSPELCRYTNTQKLPLQLNKHIVHSDSEESHSDEELPFTIAVTSNAQAPVFISNNRHMWVFDGAQVDNDELEALQEELRQLLEESESKDFYTKNS